MRALIVCVFVIFLNQVYFAEGQYFQKKAGDRCNLNSGKPGGICKSFTDCDENLLRQEPGQPSICAWSADAIVCCPPAPVYTRPRPTPAPALLTISESKSTRKCREYQQMRCKTGATHTIIGGQLVERPDEFPHMAILGYGDNPQDLSWKCGGALISDQYILTAAHCITSREGSASVANLGFINLQNRNEFNSLQTRNIIEIITHPQRDAPRKYHDIALMKLDRPVQFTDNVFPACLHEDYEIPGGFVTATGWGHTALGQDVLSDDLMKVRLTVHSNSQCRSVYESNRNLLDSIRDTEQFCAGDQDKDTCQGDSGGPVHILKNGFQCMHDIIGVTSFGKGCGNEPGVYTRVSNYVRWIESVVWP